MAMQPKVGERMMEHKAGTPQEVAMEEVVTEERLEDMAVEVMVGQRTLLQRQWQVTLQCRVSLRCKADLLDMVQEMLVLVPLVDIR